MDHVTEVQQKIQRRKIAMPLSSHDVGPALTAALGFDPTRTVIRCLSIQLDAGDMVTVSLTIEPTVATLEEIAQAFITAINAKAQPAT